MKTSYLYQAINLLSTLLLLVGLLAYLDPGRYLEWVLFTTIAGAVIQLESSLNVISTRHLSRAIAGGASISAALKNVRLAYRKFALAASLGMLFGGGAYLALVDNGRFGDSWPLEWLVFSLAYAVYYLFAYYSCVLVALGRAATFARAAMVARIFNVGLSLLLVARGWGVIGLVASLVSSFCIGAVTYRVLAQNALWAREPLHPASHGQEAERRLAVRSIYSHAAFIIGSYSLYRIGLLVAAAASSDTAFQASYGLALQLLTMVVTIALVPLNMRVTPLVEAVATKKRSEIAREAATLGVYVNLVYATAATALVIFSGSLDRLLPTRGTTLPSQEVLALLAGAFFIEVNLFVIVNVLLAAQRYRFTFDYYISAACGLVLAAMAWTIGVDLVVAFLLLPMLAQVFIAFPTLCRRMHLVTGVKLGDYAHAFVARALLMIRHPIKVGLAFR